MGRNGNQIKILFTTIRAHDLTNSGVTTALLFDPAGNRGGSAPGRNDKIGPRCGQTRTRSIIDTKQTRTTQDVGQPGQLGIFDINPLEWLCQRFGNADCLINVSGPIIGQNPNQVCVLFAHSRGTFLIR